MVAVTFGPYCSRVGLNTQSGRDRARLPLADILVRIVDVGVDVTAGELHGRLAAALERHVDELGAGRVLDQAVSVWSVSFDWLPPILRVSGFALAASMIALGVLVGCIAC